MEVDAFISWLVGESLTISDPAFIARCFACLLVMTFITAVIGQIISVIGGR